MNDIEADSDIDGIREKDCDSGALSDGELLVDSDMDSHVPLFTQRHWLDCDCECEFDFEFDLDWDCDLLGDGHVIGNQCHRQCIGMNPRFLSGPTAEHVASVVIFDCCVQ